ncbi:MAG: hypothetical protein GY811_10760 [Myxococcales bacterium]|nr:hypothetical protein [Myxococcales bacterium]
MLTQLRVGLLCLPLVFTTRCLVDHDDRCGEGQVYVELTGTCQCVEGMELAENDHVCQRTPPTIAGLGDACSNTTLCTSLDFSHCADSPSGSYCTRPSCESNTECDVEYSCNTSGDAAFCERPQQGQGESCTSHVDCEGGAATYCETTLSNQCLVQGCEPGSCLGTWECCDLSSFGLEDTLCLPEGQCPE